MLTELFEVFGATGALATVIELATVILGIWKLYDIAGSYKK